MQLSWAEWFLWDVAADLHDLDLMDSPLALVRRYAPGGVKAPVVSARGDA